ncbi:DUF4249 family protein [Jiulongibacter sediminis]|uniref:DUF4249 domain-containing protein n=1 Tax=Jiulongibacter sediminis TaxID=1605367 RepID=A0A0P7BDB2_9BACT|nr:DUF4249 family protein [Jiulongibacter sediminis]KPM48686.1 hypothetical protein AFM12_08825 [Jiulongibacter sediminis]TBX25221.1 hypothetical protein TK44_08830 [Jiulongibacter sediminis]
MKNIAFSLLILLLIVFSCTEINDVILPGDKPVIEAFLAPGQKVSMTVFTEIPYSFNEEENVSTSISGLEIIITGDDGKNLTLNEIASGHYESSEVLGIEGTTYNMSFQYNGRTVSASTILPVKPQGFQLSLSEIERIERDFSGGFVPGQGGFGGPGGGFQQEDRTPIEVTWNNPDEVYHFVAAMYAEESLDPVTQFPEDENGFTRPARRFNNQPVLTNATNLQPQSFEYFGNYNIILYRLNPDYAALYENNNTSTQNISTPISTISNGLGIFTGVNADTLRLTVKRAE